MEYDTSKKIGGKVFYGVLAALAVSGGMWFIGGYHLPVSKNAETVSSVNATEGKKNINITLTAGENSYTVFVGDEDKSSSSPFAIARVGDEDKSSSSPFAIARVPEGGSVYDAMDILSKTASFTFSATRYAGIGYFIDSINGVKNADGNYWTLYVNGKYSTVGASAYALQGNDRIEWKYSDKANY
ncbi:MAG: DUF4430 domain-containing protein [Candidatus Wildermuthbacteria bacterium]|nr:DUF4430 domain-containing protein [Candidatus Wildermuthbacteria bacterium]